MKTTKKNTKKSRPNKTRKRNAHKNKKQTTQLKQKSRKVLKTRILKTHVRKYRNKNNKKNTRNIIGGGVNSLHELILKNIKNSKIDFSNEDVDKDQKSELKDTYKSVMFKHRNIWKPDRIKKLDELDTYINGYVNHYTIALNALKEIQEKYKFFDRLLNDIPEPSLKYLSYMENRDDSNSHVNVPVYSQIPLEYRHQFKNLHDRKYADRLKSDGNEIDMEQINKEANEEERTAWYFEEANLPVFENEMIHIN